MNNDADKNRLISLTQAEELYGFNRFYLRNLCQRGRLRAKKIAGAWITTPADVEEYIASRQERGVFREDIQVIDN